MKTKFITGGRRTGKTTKLIREAVESPWYSVIVATSRLHANYIQNMLDKMYGNRNIVPVVTIREILTPRSMDGAFTKKLYFDDLMTCIKSIIGGCSSDVDIAAAVIDNEELDYGGFVHAEPGSYNNIISSSNVSMYPTIHVNGLRRNNLFNPHIDHVIFNGPATIVFWKDGTKTVVKHDGKGRKDKRTAIMYAFMRKIYGEGKAYHNILGEIEEALK